MMPSALLCVLLLRRFTPPCDEADEDEFYAFLENNSTSAWQSYTTATTATATSELYVAEAKEIVREIWQDASIRFTFEFGYVCGATLTWCIFPCILCLVLVLPNSTNQHQFYPINYSWSTATGGLILALVILHTEKVAPRLTMHVKSKW